MHMRKKKQESGKRIKVTQLSKSKIIGCNTKKEKEKKERKT